MGEGVVLFSNVSPFRIQELLEACSHMPYRIWSRPAGDGSFEIRCDKSQGREASGDAGGASRKAQTHAAPRRPGSNPGRSTGFKSLSKLLGL